VPALLVTQAGTNEVVQILFVLGISYPVGVSLNFLARIVGPANQRTAIDLASDPALNAIKTAFETVFAMAAGKESWRYCYGIVAKHGYSVNVELFSRLDIFCRAMMTGSAITFVACIALWIAGHLAGGTYYLSWMLVASGSMSLVFLFSARTYSKAFVGAIYEGFYSWYVDTKLP
jgi:hypothetical protein